MCSGLCLVRGLRSEMLPVIILIWNQKESLGSPEGKSISVVFGLLIRISEIFFQFWTGFFIFPVEWWHPKLWNGVIRSRYLCVPPASRTRLVQLQDVSSRLQTLEWHFPLPGAGILLKCAFVFPSPVWRKWDLCALEAAQNRGYLLYPLKSPIICLQVLKPKRTINPDCT